MKRSKVVNKRIRITGRGVNLVGDVNAAVVVNAEKGGRSVTHASSRQRVTQAGASPETGRGSFR